MPFWSSQSSSIQFSETTAWQTHGSWIHPPNAVDLWRLFATEIQVATASAKVRLPSWAQLSFVWTHYSDTCKSAEKRTKTIKNIYRRTMCRCGWVESQNWAWELSTHQSDIVVKQGCRSRMDKACLSTLTVVFRSCPGWVVRRLTNSFLQQGELQIQN